jgi:spore germination protein KC
MKNWPRLLKVLLVLVLSFSASGCWDRIEVNDVAIVLATAVDLEEDGQYRVSVQMALPGQMGGPSGGGGGTSGANAFYVDSDKGQSIRQAHGKLQRRLSRRLFFAHRRVLVIGESLARKGIRETFDVVARIPENRLSSLVIVAKGKGFDLLNAHPQFERYSAEAMREIVSGETVLSVDLKDVAQQMSENGTDPLIPLMGAMKPEIGAQQTSSGGTGEKSVKKEVKLLGYAQFRDDKMVGVFQGDAEEGVRWLRMKFRPYSKTLNVPGGIVSVSVNKGMVRIKPELRPDHVHYNVRVDATAYALEASSGLDLGKTEVVSQLRKELAKGIRSSILAAADKIRENNADSGALGTMLGRRKPRQWTEQYRQRWYKGELEKFDLTIDVETRISRIGLITENIAKREQAIDE